MGCVHFTKGILSALGCIRGGWKLVGVSVGSPTLVVKTENYGTCACRIYIASSNKKKLQSKKGSNTGLKCSLRAIERYAYCLGYLYFTPRYGFPKSSGTVPTFCNKIRVISFNDQVHTTPHPVLNFLGIYMSPVQ